MLGEMSRIDSQPSLARQHYRQEHSTLANVNVGGIRRRAVWFDVAPVKVVTPGSFESIDLTTWLVPYP